MTACAHLRLLFMIGCARRAQTHDRKTEDRHAGTSVRAKSTKMDLGISQHTCSQPTRPTTNGDNPTTMTQRLAVHWTCAVAGLLWRFLDRGARLTLDPSDSLLDSQSCVCSLSAKSRHGSAVDRIESEDLSCAASGLPRNNVAAVFSTLPNTGAEQLCRITLAGRGEQGTGRRGLRAGGETEG